MNPQIKMPSSMTVFVQRYRKHLTLALYVIVLGFCGYILYDPELIIGLMLPTSNNLQDKAMQQSSADQAFYEMLGADFQPAPKPTPQRVVHLPFVPKHHECAGLFEKAGHNFSYSDFYWEHLDSYKSALSISGIMRESNVDEVSWMFHEISMMPFIETVCETGFRAGHYSFQWLTGKPEVVTYSFESNKFNFTEDIATFMTAEFPDRFYFYPGDSARTIPKFHAKNNETLCDLIFVDPTKKSEEQFSTDIDNFKKMKHPDGNMFVTIVYSNGDRADTNKVWNKKVKNGEIVEQFRCTFDPLPTDEEQKSIMEQFNMRNEMHVEAIYVGTLTGK